MYTVGIFEADVPIKIILKFKITVNNSMSSFKMNKKTFEVGFCDFFTANIGMDKRRSNLGFIHTRLKQCIFTLVHFFK